MMPSTFVAVLLILTCAHCNGVHGFDIQQGGVMTESLTLTKFDSPYRIASNVLVTEHVTLTVQPSVELRFSPGVMLAINGTLIAEGLPNERITFTKDTDNVVPKWPADIRLVDDRSVMYGRLQMLYKGKWRGVCANSENWTEVDTNIACQQLGFNNGSFNFISWARNASQFMLYHRPNCTGSERNMLQCVGNRNIRVGSRVCLQQKTIHLHCDGLAPDSPAADNWWGLEFYNATLRRVKTNNILINESASVLAYVDIVHAGLDDKRQPVAALRASPTAPFLHHVTISHSALDGTNFSDVRASTVVQSSRFSNNRGHGLVVETHFGRVAVRDSSMLHNGGIGLKAKFLDGRHYIFHRRETFCERVNLPGNSQAFPLVISGIPPSSFGGPCKKIFRTRRGQILTLNVLEMDIEDSASGELRVFDGDSAGYPLTTYTIRNGTLPQGFTSTRHALYVEFHWRRTARCLTLYDCVKFTIMVDSGADVVPEFQMHDSTVNNNTQYGVFLENVRNYALIKKSSISSNGYGAGLRVFGGAGDVHVNYSTVNYNQDNGVNITYDGGRRTFNMSSFSHNHGNGVNITLNETRVDNKTRYARHQLTEVSGSEFRFNEGLGVRVGNYCRAGKAVVNDSLFEENRGGGIEFESCFRAIGAANVTNFTAAHNTFVRNFGHAVKIAPILSVVGRIANNTFERHPRYVLLLDNGDEFDERYIYTSRHVRYDVSGNEFRANAGLYVVNARLTQGSARQSLDILFNQFRDNVIRGAFPRLNQRTRVHAVVIVSSSNIRCVRNALVDPDSRYELATHLRDQSVELTAHPQWWGSTDYAAVVPRIFDQYSRYDLARIQYHPALKYDLLYGSWTTHDQRPLEVDFDRGSTLGGRLAHRFATQPGRRYVVDRDIYVRPGGHLRLSAGTTLQFGNGLGMLVQGLLEVDGVQGNRVMMTLHDEDTFTNHTLVRLAGEEDGDDDDAGGRLHGRLEMRPTEADEWGSVCDEGWTQTDASIVCQMMGLVVHPDSWRVSARDAPRAPDATPIWRSNVECTELDMDVTQCAADMRADHSCTHAQDVYVRCVRPNWAGVRLLATASRSRLLHVTVTRAGLLDPSPPLYTPAVTIDYNTHQLESVNVSGNAAAGVRIAHNEAFSRCRLLRCVISHNLGAGVETRGPFLELLHTVLHDNGGAGLLYDPRSTAAEAAQIRAGVHAPIMLDAVDAYALSNEGIVFVGTRPTPAPAGGGRRTYELEVSVEAAHRVALHLLDYEPDTAHENLTVFDAARDRVDAAVTRQWRLEDDLVDFPIVSTEKHLTIRWTVEGAASGRLAFVLRSKPWNWAWPFADLTVRNTTSRRNAQGIVARHYNHASNEHRDLFFRYRWQTVRLFGVSLEDNAGAGLHVPSISKYHDLYTPTFAELERRIRIAEVTFEIEACAFLRNGDGLVVEHDRAEFSNNVWLWRLSGCRFERNRGGLRIALPKVNLMERDLYNHSVDVNDTTFERNTAFEFHVGGFYCNSSITGNRFRWNVCPRGCVTIGGTEKDFEFEGNELTENEGRYMLAVAITSHTPYTPWVEASVRYNSFRRNRRPAAATAAGGGRGANMPSSYAVGITGLQNVTVNRNLLDNPELDYELVGAQQSSRLESYLDVTENWWGTTDQAEIRARIFDFDDWNSYAIAEYHPYLVGDYVHASVTSAARSRPALDLSRPLGGRVETALRLTKRAAPYIVASDLTVMPGASLYIEAGVEIQFHPQVGILVLGTLTAHGYVDDRIRMGPVEPPSGSDADWTDAALTGENIRFVGGATPAEGFLQLYNATERLWVLVCDSHFDEYAAAVACRSAGHGADNVMVRRSRWYDDAVLHYAKMHEQLVEWFWRRSYSCVGDEPSLAVCRDRPSYQLVACMEAREYVWVRCGPRSLAPRYAYWGNLRFAPRDFEQDGSGGFSFLEHVDIHGAGQLHGERAAAVFSVIRTPMANGVHVSSCAWNGYDFIAPAAGFNVINGVLRNNHGYGVGALVLNGESRYQAAQSSFTPLDELTLPYGTHGLVRMCSVERLVYVRQRVLLYHKYSLDTVDCVKVLRSREPRKTVALRFLQLRLSNDSFTRNAVQMYAGDYFDADRLIGEVTAMSPEDRRSVKYETLGDVDTLGVRVMSSPATGEYGFIAEVVTLPLSPGLRPDLGPGDRQRVHNMDMSGNERGGLRFVSVGELNPSVQIESCRIENGGVEALNMTGPPVMSLLLQNARLLTIANNHVRHNHGGIEIHAYTHTLATALYANITNNVISYNTHATVLHIEGHHYQGFEVAHNYISHNRADLRNVIAMFGVRLNFTENVLHDNYGRTVLNATVLRKVNINQRYHGNALYDNRAVGANKTTVFLGSAKHSFRHNFFRNRWNNFEMVTFNRTRYPGEIYPKVEATNNWWGGGDKAFVSGRIWERTDDDYLIGVEFSPFYTSNTSILEGRCFPGWMLHEKKCYRYMGGVAPYDLAEKQCKTARARIAWANDRAAERFLGEVVARVQRNYNPLWHVWVYSRRQRDNKCSALADYSISYKHCDRLYSYICERDPYVQPSMAWRTVIIVLGVIGGIAVLICLLLVFACTKARARTAQRLTRRDSLRASLRSSKASVFTNRTASREDDVVQQRRRRPPLDHSLDLSGVTLGASSTDSIDKLKLDARRPATPASLLDYTTDRSSYYDSDLPPDPPTPYEPPPYSAAAVGAGRLENEIGGMAARPMYGDVLRNAGYDERSLDGSQALSVASLGGVTAVAPSPRRPLRPQRTPYWLDGSASSDNDATAPRPPRETMM